MPFLPWLADFLRLLGGEFQNCCKSFQTQMRLVTECHGEMGQSRLPTRPTRSAMQRTEHALFGRWIKNWLGDRASQTVQFGLQHLIIQCADDHDLPGPKLLPLSEQMAQNGRR